MVPLKHLAALDLHTGREHIVGGGEVIKREHQLLGSLIALEVCSQPIEFTLQEFVHTWIVDGTLQSDAFFACPACGTVLGEIIDGQLSCSNETCHRRWRHQDGLYDFKEPLPDI